LSDYTPEFTLETSRGCPYRCRYCYNANYNRGKWRTMSTENVVKELRRIKEQYKCQSVLFIDDNFFVDIKHTRAILERIAEEKLFSTWGSAGMRIDTLERVDESFIDLMKKSGCYAIETGIESLSDKVLTIINKGITKQRILELNRLFGKHKILLACNFVVGFPGEDVEDLRETTRAIVQMAEENPYMKLSFISIFQPYPGTALYPECVKLGLKEPERLEDWITWAWDNVASWRSDEMNKLLDAINSAGYGLRHNKHNPSKGILLDSASTLARSVSMFRLKHFVFTLMIENHLKRIVSNTRKLSSYRF
jgi:anaerobic magnesium-protoporphyrin IX monomethyl ester cyclase